MTTFQFQTTHGQRQLPVFALTVLFLFAGVTTVGVLVDVHGRIPGFSLPLGVALVIAVAVYGSRFRRYGLEITPGWVGRDGPMGAGHLAQAADEPSPRLSLRRHRDVESLRVTDFQGQEMSVPWLVLVLRSNVWQKTAYGIANELLVRQPNSEDRSKRRWQSTGLVWADNNCDEIVAYLQQRIDGALTVASPAREGSTDAAVSAPRPVDSHGVE